MDRSAGTASLPAFLNSPYIHTLITFVFLPVTFLAALLLSIRIYTTLRYHSGLRRLNTRPLPSKDPLPPPEIPYTLPFLGSAFQFLAPYPGLFWTSLFKWHPRSSGVCSILVGGKRLNALYSPQAVHSLFRVRGLARHQTDRDILLKGFGVSGRDFDAFYGDAGDVQMSEEKINHEFLLKTDAVNELTTNFMQELDGLLKREKKASEEGEEVAFYAWIQANMFIASTNALMGSRLLDVYPGLAQDFIKFDNEFLGMFFGLPKFLIPGAYAVRERALAGIQRWRDAMDAETNNTVTDPSSSSTPWEPRFGSRMNRARSNFYTAKSLSPRGKAGFDLGVIFAISSNAIPAAGWMLMHIVNPVGNTTLYARVMAELKTVVNTDGSLDIPALISLPLFQSIFTEVLRLYTDVLVARDLTADLVLPLDESGKKTVLLKKNATVLAPSWLGHHDEEAWGTASASSETFYAERFLKADPDTGKTSFTLTGTLGKFFPFGGGKTICPGRVFAKQEVLAAVALVLLNFEVEVKGFVDEKGRSTEKFPGLRSAFAGSGVCVVGGDVRVKIKRRKEGGS